MRPIGYGTSSMEAASTHPADLVPLHSRFDCLGVSRIERGQVGVVHLDSDAPSRAGLA